MSSEILVKALREHGYKVTPQRVAVYNALEMNHNHPHAETIYKSLQHEHPGMSFATIYKVLDVLMKIGVVKSLDFGEGSTRFDSVMQPHHHARCLRCGKVVDLFGLHSEHLSEEVEEKSGMVISGENFVFYGLCQECV